MIDARQLIARTLTALLVLLAPLGALGADAPVEPTPVGTTANDAKTTEAPPSRADSGAPAAPSGDARGTAPDPDEFNPSESISEDTAVPFPVDI
jgi:hypothetical protein